VGFIVQTLPIVREQPPTQAASNGVGLSNAAQSKDARRPVKKLRNRYDRKLREAPPRAICECDVMTKLEYALFGTPIGPCGMVWSPAGIVGTQLPEASIEAASLRIERRFPGARNGHRTPAAAAAMARIEAMLAGARDDFADLPLDWADIGAFDRAVYRETRAIPAGETSTYGAIAARIGEAGRDYDAALPRAVGQSLGRNPWPIVIPCHRVTAADGRMGGFSAPGGRKTKLKLLELEGALGVEALPLFGSGGAG
jgi:methylated-DNA-[protein]-cysteine S-methyltransferase